MSFSMISTSEVICIHDILIERFGGSPGLREIGLLESALARPLQTFDGESCGDAYWKQLYN